MLSPEALKLILTAGSVLMGFFGKRWKKPFSRLVRKIAAKLPWNKKGEYDLLLMQTAKLTAAKNSQVDRLLERLCWDYKLNRATVAAYSYEVPPITLEDFKKGEIFITNEVADNANKIMAEFSPGVSTDIFAEGIYKLQNDPRGYICVPENHETGQTVRVQNMYDVEWSGRFKLDDKDVTRGSLAISFTHKSNLFPLTLEQLEAIRIVAMKINAIQNRKK